MTIAELIGYNLKRVMKEKHVTTNYLVDKTGISRCELFRIYRGSVLPLQININEICFALDIPEIELVRMV